MKAYGEKYSRRYMKVHSEKFSSWYMKAIWKIKHEFADAKID